MSAYTLIYSLLLSVLSVLVSVGSIVGAALLCLILCCLLVSRGKSKKGGEAYGAEGPRAHFEQHGTEEHEGGVEMAEQSQSAEETAGEEETA